jgi:hypothetical protein
MAATLTISQIDMIGAKFARSFEARGFDADNGLGDIVKIQGKARNVELKIESCGITVRTGDIGTCNDTYEHMPAGLTIGEIVDHTIELADKNEEIQAIGEFISRNLAGTEYAIARAASRM